MFKYKIWFSLLISITIMLLTPSQKASATSFTTAGYRLNKNVKTMHEIKRERIVSQSLDFSCGAAGLSTLLNYHLNDPTPEKEIIASLLQLVPLQKVKERRGFSMLDLKKYIESRGYKATGYTMDIEFLKSLNHPVLVPIKFKNYRHFVIVKEIIGDRVFFADPAAGNMSMKADKFNRIWLKGIGLVIEDENREDKKTALSINQADLRIADYKAMKDVVNRSLVHTTIYPNEY